MFAVPENTVLSAVRTAPQQPTNILREVVADRSSWAHLLRYDPVERWTALVRSTSSYEVWLMSWLPGQGAELHDHGGAEGAFTVVSGVLTELVGRPGHAGEAMHVLHPGQSRVFGPNYVHQMRNAGVDPAVSIHVFGPTRQRMTPYRFDPVQGPVTA
ncbi:cysteine dioxygenase [Kutzneria kofuensis]|jgi:mannose-6-phosphate isomerase-like protein (cupin superfamily)|uniref:Mannose-6-phosphate isomerase-like protein (Cupin superfamily) n=1 Tax=Kutzneria kofuensis TaxID=103725 RepID=A0A7W9NJD3_9PSEU|nr:cysteine dioxygenase family protein [Kutzneria kofuensis]MBB5894038.1 mannose-6-phosphate isomerase-like protein (cupin superfamily) [Kutzneria kofuensis]